MFDWTSPQPARPIDNPLGQLADMDPVQAMALLYGSRNHPFARQVMLPAQSAIHTANHVGPLGKLFGMDNPLGNFLMLRWLMGHRPSGGMSPSQSQPSAQESLMG